MELRPWRRIMPTQGYLRKRVRRIRVRPSTIKSPQSGAAGARSVVLQLQPSVAGVPPFTPPPSPMSNSLIPLSMRGSPPFPVPPLLHRPRWHSPPGGQMTPWQGSSAQIPFSHTRPIGQSTSKQESSRHCPSAQTSGYGQVTRAHGSARHSPLTQSAVSGHETVLQSSKHRPSIHP